MTKITLILFFILLVSGCVKESNTSTMSLKPNEFILFDLPRVQEVSSSEINLTLNKSKMNEIYDVYTLRSNIELVREPEPK